jgi:ribosomal protein L23
LIQPRLSEKAVKLNGINKYVFKVSNSSNKVQVKKAVEKFLLKVEKGLLLL